jgi:hypothetical protein
VIAQEFPLMVSHSTVLWASARREVPGVSDEQIALNSGIRAGF